MAKKPRENRVPIMMSDEEVTKIDDWRFANRIATRSEAVRKLCQIGLIFDKDIEPLVTVIKDIFDQQPSLNELDSNAVRDVLIKLALECMKKIPLSGIKYSQIMSTADMKENMIELESINNYIDEIDNKKEIK